MILISHPPGYSAERTYVFDILLREFLGLDYRAESQARDNIRLALPQGHGGKELILPDILFQTPEDEWLKPSSMPRQPLTILDLSVLPTRPTVTSPTLPVIYGSKLYNGSFFELLPHRLSLGIDIFGSAFFMLTRYEEVVRDGKDSHHRFPAASSLAYQENFLDRPIVNEYLEVLWWALKHLWPGVLRRPRVSRLMLSHDVDHPLYCIETSAPRTLKNIAADILVRKDPKLALKRARSLNNAKTPCLDNDVWNTFDYIMSLSERHGITSTFNFMTQQGTGSRDCRYSIEAPWIRQLIRRIHDRGHQVGLHPSYGSHQYPEQIKCEFARLRHVCAGEGVDQASWGGRQHYLLWHNPTTWQGWEDAGLSYDSTLSFADHAGFRCGTCYEFPAFNLRERRRLRLLEYPLIVMEDSLLTYMGLSPDKALERTLDLYRKCKTFQGNFTLLWHNHSVASNKEKEIYRTVVTELATSSYWRRL